MLRKRSLLLLLFVCLPAYAAVFDFELQPASPTERNVITARFDVNTVCEVNQATIVTGNTVRTTVTHSNCFPGPPPYGQLVEAAFGPLAPGTYTYEVYEDHDGDFTELTFTTTIVVGAVPAPIPALQDAALGIFAAALAAVAMIALRRGA